MIFLSNGRSVGESCVTERYKRGEGSGRREIWRYVMG